MILIGNGDVQNLGEARDLAKRYDLDGVMIGRAIFGDPLLFREFDWTKLDNTQKIKLKINLLVIHLRLWQKDWQKEDSETIIDIQPKNKAKKSNLYLKDYSALKRFFKVYISDFEGSKDLRQKLMETTTIEESFEILSAFVVW